MPFGKRAPRKTFQPTRDSRENGHAWGLFFEARRGGVPQSLSPTPSRGFAPHPFGAARAPKKKIKKGSPPRAAKSPIADLNQINNRPSHGGGRKKPAAWTPIVPEEIQRHPRSVRYDPPEREKIPPNPFFCRWPFEPEGGPPNGMVPAEVMAESFNPPGVGMSFCKQKLGLETRSLRKHYFYLARWSVLIPS